MLATGSGCAQKARYIVIPKNLAPRHRPGLLPPSGPDNLNPDPHLSLVPPPGLVLGRVLGSRILSDAARGCLLRRELADTYQYRKASALFHLQARLFARYNYLLNNANGVFSGGNLLQSQNSQGATRVMEFD